MTPNGKHHCDTLDLIRALAAGAVCISHLRNLMFVDYRRMSGTGLAGKAFYFLSNYGHTAVIVFFLLSGYFVGGSVLRQVEAGTWSWQRYLTERLSRLWIVLIPALLLTLFWDRMGSRWQAVRFIWGPKARSISRSMSPRTSVRRRCCAISRSCRRSTCRHLSGPTVRCGASPTSSGTTCGFPRAMFCSRRRRRFQRHCRGGARGRHHARVSRRRLRVRIWMLGVVLVLLEKRIPDAQHANRSAVVHACQRGSLFIAALVLSRIFLLSNDWIVGVPCFAFLRCILWENVRLRPAVLSRLAIHIFRIFVLAVPDALLVHPVCRRCCVRAADPVRWPRRARVRGDARCLLRVRVCGVSALREQYQTDPTQPPAIQNFPHRTRDRIGCAPRWLSPGVHTTNRETPSILHPWFALVCSKRRRTMRQVFNIAVVLLLGYLMADRALMRAQAGEMGTITCHQGRGTRQIGRVEKRLRRNGRE